MVDQSDEIKAKIEQRRQLYKRMVRGQGSGRLMG